MGAISRKLDRFCYKHPNFGIPQLMKYIALGNVAVFLLNMFSQGYFANMLRFVPGLILDGQIWRLVTFVLVPISMSPLWFALSVYLYYSLGSALEQRWGTTRFTVFYGLAVVLNIIVGLLTYLVSPGYGMMETANMHYVNLSIFLAFGTLYPDLQFMLYFIIPVKAKWLVWFDAALFAFDIGGYVIAGDYFRALLPVVAILNYLVFFWDDLMEMLGRGRRRAAHRMDPQTINFKKAQKQVQERKGYLHKCAVCGVTDADDPEREFRYCSRCNGYYCYCMDHINDHVHIQ